MRKSIWAILLLPFTMTWAQPDVLITIQPNGARTPVSPYIYGKNNVMSTHPDQPVTEAVWLQNEDAGVTLIRSCGGNNLSKYNWRKKITSHPDWYNNVYESDWDYAMESLQERLPGVQTMWGFQLLGKVADNTSHNFNDWTYNKAAWWSGVSQNLAGGGTPNSTGGSKATKEGDTNLYLQNWTADSTVAILDYWYKTKGIKKEQTRFWSMDNEPEIWNGTHDDVMPVQCSAEEFMQRYFEVAKKARQADPAIQLVGPVTANEWQWFKYAQDTKIDGKHYCWLEYFIKRCAEEQKATGIRLLDVLCIHFYPSETNAADILQLHRVFFDETYVYPGANGIKTMNGGWDNTLTREYIFARCNQWLTTYFGENHGIGLGLSETGINTTNTNLTACWYASQLGEFMKHGVTLFSPWDWKPGMYEVLHLNTKYNHAISIPATSTNEELVSAYATINSTGDSITVQLVNRSQTASKSISINTGTFTPSAKAHPVCSISNLPQQTETFVSAGNNAMQQTFVTPVEGTVTLTLPPLSVQTV
ncbi:MAG: hypothetical protein JXR54_01105, partial [Tannerellaceae bacterium]|nr:hypothetical protein [Tannerellaceae bacterium]